MELALVSTMTRARLAERGLVLLGLALAVAGRPELTHLGHSRGLPAAVCALAALVLAAALRARAGRVGRAAAGVLHAVALLAAASAEDGARARAEIGLVEPTPAGRTPRTELVLAGDSASARLWLGRVVGCPLPEVGSSRRAVVSLVRMLGPAGATGPVAPAVAAPQPDWIAVRGRVEVVVDQPLAPGEWWLVRGVLFRPLGQRNPGGFDGRAQAERLRLAGRIALARPSAAERLQRAPPAWRRPDCALQSAIAQVRYRAHAELAARLRPEAAGLTEAMAFGARGSLVDRVQADFRWLGWSHLVAVSGMNVGFVAGLAGSALGLARIRRRGPLIALVLLLHAAVTGGQPPIARATWMALAALAARALGRSLPGSRALALSAGLCLASEPAWLGDPSFQLSFGALVGMSLVAPGIDWADPLALLRGRPGRWLLVPLVSGCGAQLGCLPILATQFHWLSPWGIATGPIAIPLASLVVSGTWVALGLALLCPPLGPALSGGTSVLGESLLALSRLGARHLCAPWPMAEPGPAAILIFGVALLALGTSGLRLGRERGRLRFGLALVLVGLASAGLGLRWPAAAGAPARVEVIFLDVGQGDAALILTYGRRGWIERLGFGRAPQRALVIDTGDHPRDGFDCGAGIVAPALAALGVQAIDQVFLTHGDRDHAGGFPGLDTWLPVRELVWPRALALPPALRAAWRREVAGRRAPVRVPKRPPPRLRLAAAGDRFPLGPGVALEVLHPAAEFAGRGNDGSLTMRLEAFGRAVLFLGDLEVMGETALVQASGAEALAAEVVKVAHHGSATSSTPDLVGAARARVAVVSVGARNRFGHPSPEVIERWRASGAEVIRTDRGGAVWVRLTEGRAGLAAGPCPTADAFAEIY